MINLGIISLILILIDQIIKYVVDSNILLDNSIKIIDGFFNLTYVRNTGAAFSILENNQIFLIFITVVALIIIFLYLKNKKLTKFEILTYALIIGGIIGNLIDRIIHGYVIDYLDFSFISFPIFNFADSLIVIGTFMLFIKIIVGEKNERIQNIKRNR